MTAKRHAEWHIVLGVVFFGQVMATTGFSLVFPFFPLYVDSLGSIFDLPVELLAGLVIGVQGFTMMLASPLWGAAADRIGRKPMVMRAAFGGTVIMFMMGFVNNAEQLILLRGIQGLITGTVAANNALVAAKVPRERLGFAMGLLQVGLWSGLAVGPLIGGYLADQYGYAMPFVFTSALLFLSGVLIYFFIDEQFVPETDTNQQRPSIMQQWGHVLAAPGVRLVYFMRFLSAAGRVMIIPIAPLFVISLLPPTVENQSIYAGLLIAVSSLSATLSGVYLGNLGDRIGHRSVIISMGILTTLLYIPQVFVTTVWQLVGLQALTGLALGGLLTAPSALLAQYTERGEEGSVYGLDNSIVAGARAIAPLVGGVAAGLFGYRGTFALTAVLFGVVAITAWTLLPEVNVRKRKLAVA